MKSLTKILALAALATTLSLGAAALSAEAKGWHGGGQGGQGGHYFGGSRFQSGHGGNNCWQFGRWVCGYR